VKNLSKKGGFLIREKLIMNIVESHNKELTGPTSFSSVLVSIQLSRVIAVLSVVYRHHIQAGAKFPIAGAVGVDIFFIISGFVIAYVVSRSTDSFLIKRLIKIMPMYILAVTATALAVILFPNAVYSLKISVSGFVKSILFIPFVENKQPTILTQGWTLYYEMFFYVVMFFCILFVKKKYLTFSCISVIVFVIIIKYLIFTEDSILNFYCGELSFEFIGGIILYHLYCRFDKKQNKKLINRKAKIITLLFLGVVSYWFLFFSEIYRFWFSQYRSINYGIPAFILVGSLLFLEDSIKNIKTLKTVSLKIGDASYIIYLIHFHIQAFLVRVVFSRITIFNGDFIAMEIVKFLFISAIIIIISMAMHKYIEKPIQNYFRKKLKKA